MKKLFALVFIVLFLITITIYKYMEISKDEAIQNLADKTLEFVKIANKAVLDTYMVVAKKDFFDIMKNGEVLKILSKFKYATIDEQNILRGELYRLLYKDYELLKKLNVRQFHFHTYDGKSLLRFHLPYKNGDNLMSFRKSVKIANTKFKPVSGFEGGRVYPGYRYVFPITYDEDHLGSVEFSVSFEGIEKKLKNIVPFYGHRIIFDKEIIYNKIFKKNRELFVESKFSSDYYSENYCISKSNGDKEHDKFVDKVTKLVKDSPNFMKKLNSKKSFAIPIIDNNLGYIVTFLNVKNIDNKSAAYVISFGKFQDIVGIQQRYNNLVFIGLFVAIFIYLLVITVLFQVQKIKVEASKLQKFIDIQNSIVILTNGVKFKFANKKFFDFFGYRDLEYFLQEHYCICEHFLEMDNFFNLSHVMDSEDSWVDSLLNLQGSKRIVSMRDKNSIIHAFSVSINKYDEDNYIIDFSDISDTMREKIQLQEQVIKDQLTKAYNRVYFEKNIDSLIAINREKGKETGIIFFDIDHFKNVNDTYGHQVGDDVLKTIVKIVNSNIRDDDKLIRWGGEEFIIIFCTSSIENVYKKAEHLRVSIEQYRFDEVGSLTCSFGVILHNDSYSIDESIKKADAKLYEAKNSGRNRVVV